MKIDPEHFATLVPIDSLREAYRGELLRFARIEVLARDEVLFHRGQRDSSVYYLQNGEIELQNGDQASKRIRTGNREALYPLANEQPRPYRATVTSRQAGVIKVSRRLLDKMLAWAQVAEPDASASADNGDVPVADGEDQEWMGALLRTQAFLRLPSANLSRLFRTMEPISLKAGDTVIRQGEAGDYFYIIKSGTCRVSRSAQGRETRLADLSACDSFGEEALLSGAARNADVTMLTDGVLMRLSKTQFSELLKEPLIQTVSPDEVDGLLRQGAIRIDVRFENEFERDGLKNSLNIPLYMLRLKAPRLDPKRKYILYCDTGERSSAAAFLMSSMGFDTYLLKTDHPSSVVKEIDSDG